MSTSLTLRRRARLRLESLEPREMMAFDPTPMEQEMLEHLNRMRMNPQGELNVLFSSRPSPLVARDSSVQSAITYFGVDGNVLQSQWASLTAAPPLAWNSALTDAAAGHNQQMITNDEQSHQLAGESSLLTRIVDAGYNWSGSVGVGENIFAYATSVLYAHAGFAIDWGTGTGGIQTGAGHRVNMMNSSFQEVGISITPESNSSTSVGPLVVTQDFGRRGNYGNAALVGVVFADGNSDGQYQAGEQRGGVQITVSGPNGTFTTTSMTAGGYQLQLPAGTYTVTASGGSLTQPMVVNNVVVGTNNVKVDFKVGSTTTPTKLPDRIGVQRSVTYFRDVNGNGLWDSPTDVSSNFGASGDTPLAGDWNGDGRDEIGSWRGARFYLDANGNGIWNTGDVNIGFGLPTDRPLVGDWDGDGRDQIGVWRSGTFYLDMNGNLAWDAADRTAKFGLSTDVPLVGDWDGDGRDQIAVKRGNIFYLDQDGNYGWNTGDISFGFGLSTDTALVGDWNGDGKDQLGVWRSGTFYLDTNGSNSWNTGDVTAKFGLNTDRPYAGQWSAVTAPAPPPSSSLSSTSTVAPKSLVEEVVAPAVGPVPIDSKQLATLAAAVDQVFASSKSRQTHD
ncbi:MAG: CAP domain-containing protein [Pirellulales bacterium]